MAEAQDKKRGRPQQNVSLGTIYNEAKGLFTEERPQVLAFIREVKEKRNAEIAKINNDNVDDGNDDSEAEVFV